MADALNELTIAEARDGLRRGDFTAVEITEACLCAIDSADILNSVVHKTPEKAREMAVVADKRLQSEKGSAPDMCGVPLGIKDLFCTNGVASQAASRMLTDFKPPYESTVTTQLFADGAIMLGKLNMDEFKQQP